MIIETKDLDEATFYLQFGGNLILYEKEKLRENTAKRQGHKTIWHFTIDNVDKKVYDLWSNGTIYSDIKEFLKTRKKLKMIIK